MASNQTLNIEINGKTVALERSVKTVNGAISNLRAEAASLKRELDLDPNNVELTANRHKVLAQALALSHEKAKILKEELDKVNPDVDPKSYYQLEKQMMAAERSVRTYNHELELSSKHLERVSNLARTFSFNPGSGIKEFQNSISGVDAAIESIGGIKDLKSFDAASASSKSLESYLKKSAQASELLSRKAELLKGELEGIDVASDPKGFAEIQKQLNNVNSDILKIEENKVTVDVDFNSNASTFGDSIGSHLKTSTSSAISGVTGLLKGVPNLIASGLGNVAGVVGNTLKSGLSSAASFAGKSIVAPFKFVGGTISNAITAPLSGLSNAVGTIVQGSLLTVGNKVVNGLTSTFSGVMKSMEDTSRSAKSLDSILSFSDVDASTIDNIKNSMADYAKTTSFGSSELNNIVGSLTAANVKAEDTVDLTKNIANSYALLGDGSRNISDIGVIFSQINSATKLTAQDFNQLRDAGIGGALKQEIERSFPAIISEFGTFNKAMEEGAISAEMVNTAISNIGSSDAAVKAATVPKTMSEALDTLNETIGQKFQGVFEDLSSKGIDFVSDITNAIDGMDFSGILAISDSFIDVFNTVKSSFTSIIGSIDLSSITSKFKTLDFGSLFESINFEKIIGDIISVGSTVSSTLSSIFNSQAFTDAGSAFVEVINKSIGSVTAIINPILDVFTDERVLGTISTLSDMFVSIFRDVENFAKSPFIQTFISGFVDVLLPTVNLLSNTFKQLVSIVTGFFSGMDWSAISDPISQIVENLGSIIKNFLDPIQSKIKELQANGTLDKMWESFSKFGGVLKSLLKTIKPVYDFIAKLIGLFVAESIEAFVEFVTATTNALTSLYNVFDDMLKVIGSFGNKALDWLGGVLGYNSVYSAEGSSVPAAYSSNSAVYSNRTTNATINVHASPGMSASDLARKVVHEINLGTA